MPQATTQNHKITEYFELGQVCLNQLDQINDDQINDDQIISDQEKRLILSAGIFAAEGCVTIVRSHFNYRIIVSNTEYSIVKTFKDEFGGSIINKSKKYDDRTLRWYEWNIYGVPAINMVKKVLPYMEFSKRGQMVLMLELHEIKNKYRKEFGNKHYTDDMKKQMKHLYDEIKRLKSDFDPTIKVKLTGIRLLIFLVGVFIGEGCVSINNKKGNCYTHLIVANTEYSIVKTFKDEFGGSIINKNLQHYKDGCNRKPKYEWSVWGGLATNIINMMLPYMEHSKKQQMVLGLTLHEIKNKYRKEFGNKHYTDQMLKKMVYIFNEVKRLKRESTCTCTFTLRPDQMI